MNPSTSRFHPWRKLSRPDVLLLIQTAFSCQDYHFAAQVALDWLTDFPGDLPLRFLYAQARANGGHFALAATLLDDILQKDPEYIKALKLRLKIEQELYQNNLKVLRVYQPKSPYSLTDYQEWLIALEGYDAATTKRPYDRLELRWGEEIVPLRKSLAKYSALWNQYSLEEFQNQLRTLLAVKPNHPLIAITHLEGVYLSYKAGAIPFPVLRQLVQHYQRAFPNCLYIGYVAVEVCLENGEEEQAVASLHSLAARDLTAQVALRLWSADHPFLDMWPKTFEKQLTIAIPARIAAILGWNRLPRQASESPLPQSVQVRNSLEIPKQVILPEKSNGGEQSYAEETPSRFIELTDTFIPSISEELRDIQQSFDRIGTRLKRPNTVHLDGRQPIYVAVTNKSQFARYFGSETTEEILQAIQGLLTAIQAAKGWRGLLYLVDEGLSLKIRRETYGIEAIPQNDPWAIKRGIQQLDNLLAKQGEMIGALLIVGSHEIIPFHRLPNPLEDEDVEVFSDNPYASRDENYLVMDWPLGRLPCSLRHPDQLVKLIQNLSAPYQRLQKTKAKTNGYAKSLSPLWSWLQYLISLFQPTTFSFTAFGYTAAVWRFASFAVFRQIGNPQSMLISPQMVNKTNSAEMAKRRLVRHTKAVATIEQLKPDLASATQPLLAKTEHVNLPSATAGYFNLHGLADSPEWFGQSDPTEEGNNLVATTDHPIALQPGDILLNPNSQIEFIFTEACFGAYVNEKEASTSIALAFLQKGCRAFVGSTSISYGSTGTPLNAADLLAYEFWKYLRQGLPAGESLRQAKLTLAKEVSQRNGTLDGEDQKTLISFVLYGDPLAQVSSPKASPKVFRHTKAILPPILPVCDHALQPQTKDELTPQMESLVKKLVAQHLPGMEFTKVEVLSESQNNSATCTVCRSSKSQICSAEPTKRSSKTTRKIIILSREERRNNHVYTQYARLTLDDKGHLIKLAISR